MNFNPVFNDPIEIDTEFAPTMEPVFFKSNGSKVLGTLYLTNGKGPHPTIILLNGFPGNETNGDLAHVFCRQGFNVFNFHYRGSWGSGGNFTFLNTFDDVKAGISFMTYLKDIEKYRVDSSKLILVGYSMGGFAALLNSIDFGIKNIAAISAFNFGSFIKLISSVPMGREMAYERLARGTEFLNVENAKTLFNEMIDNAEKWELTNFASQLADKNILFLSAKYDTTAQQEVHTLPLRKRIEEITSKIPPHHLLECGHSFFSRRIELATVISNWLSQIKF